MPAHMVPLKQLPVHVATPALCSRPENMDPPDATSSTTTLLLALLQSVRDDIYAEHNIRCHTTPDALILILQHLEEHFRLQQPPCLEEIRALLLAADIGGINGVQATIDVFH